MTDLPNDLLDSLYRRDTYSTRIQDMYPRDLNRQGEPTGAVGYGPAAHTQAPIMTGTSVLAIKYKDGVMMAADCLASYGSLARVRDVRRLHKVTETAVLGASGDMSDFQHVKHILERLLIREDYHDDGRHLAPPNLFEYLWRVMYQRRSDFNPLWNMFILGGYHKGESFLGFVDLQGTTYKADTIATGFGGHLAQPLLRKAVEERGGPENIDEAEAIRLLEESMRILFYRDARSLNKFQRAKITADGVEITEPYSVETEWGFAEHIRGYGADP